MKRKSLPGEFVERTLGLLGDFSERGCAKWPLALHAQEGEEAFSRSEMG